MEDLAAYGDETPNPRRRATEGKGKRRGLPWTKKMKAGRGLPEERRAARKREEARVAERQEARAAGDEGCRRRPPTEGRAARGKEHARAAEGGEVRAADEKGGRCQAGAADGREGCRGKGGFEEEERVGKGKKGVA